jgi:hypothetical protein
MREPREVPRARWGSIVSPQQLPARIAGNGAQISDPMARWRLADHDVGSKIGVAVVSEAVAELDLSVEVSQQQSGKRDSPAALVYLLTVEIERASGELGGMN